jgi:hypothetical protein
MLVRICQTSFRHTSRHTHNFEVRFRHLRHTRHRFRRYSGPSRFTLDKERQYPLCRMPDGLQGRSGRVQKPSPPPGFDPQIVHPVASRYTDLKSII